MSLSRDQLLVLWTMNILALDDRRGLTPGVILAILDFWGDVTPARSWS
jgi:hypothetical protein